MLHHGGTGQIGCWLKGRMGCADPRACPPHQKELEMAKRCIYCGQKPCNCGANDYQAKSKPSKRTLPRRQSSGKSNTFNFPKFKRPRIIPSCCSHAFGGVIFLIALLVCSFIAYRNLFVNYNELIGVPCLVGAVFSFYLSMLFLTGEISR